MMIELKKTRDIARARPVAAAGGRPPAGLRPGPRLARKAARFRRDENGAIVIFSIFMFLIILFLGGLGVDMMRFEMERAKLQNTLDRAVLAAADLDQTLDPESVVHDYFEKAGLGSNVTSVSVTQGLGFRQVSATASKTIRTQLIHMLGVDTLSAPAAGAAEERVDFVEISMVLDISGSMDQNNRMANLRPAARNFVNAVIEGNSADMVSISIVPYNGQVNIGPSLMSKYNITDKHSNSYCVDLPNSVYNSTGLSRHMQMPQHANADTYNSSNTSGSYSTTNMAPFPTAAPNRWCDPNPVNRVRVHSNNVAQLHSQINALQPIGATSIDAGLRWGAAFLDPGTRSVVNDLVDDGEVPEHFRGRPLDYSDPEVLKVIVLMTDGENWPNEHVNDGYRSGQSPVWRNTNSGSANGQLSIYHASRAGANKYYWPHNNTWNPRPWGATVTQQCTGTIFNRVCTDIENWNNTKQLDWQEVWQQVRVQWAAYQLYQRPLGGTLANWINTLRTRTGTVNASGPHEVSQMNNRLNNLCTLMKGQNVVIYTIAFEAPANGKTVMLKCASSAAHYFDVTTGGDLDGVFSSIASSIRKLRLTQ